MTKCGHCSRTKLDVSGTVLKSARRFQEMTCGNRIVRNVRLVQHVLAITQVKKRPQGEPDSLRNRWPKTGRGLLKGPASRFGFIRFTNDNAFVAVEMFSTRQDCSLRNPTDEQHGARLLTAFPDFWRVVIGLAI